MSRESVLALGIMCRRSDHVPVSRDHVPAHRNIVPALQYCAGAGWHNHQFGRYHPNPLPKNDCLGSLP